MTFATWLAFALGAAVGAPLRFVIDGAVDRGERVRPLGTLVVNAAGSLLLGVVTALVLDGRIGDDVETIVGVGFAGAFTTFSTFALETVRLLESGETEAAVRNVALHVSISLALAAVGYAVVRGVL